MTVSELIKVLEALNEPDLPVVMFDEDFRCFFKAEYFNITEYEDVIIFRDKEYIRFTGKVLQI